MWLRVWFFGFVPSVAGTDRPVGGESAGKAPHQKKRQTKSEMRGSLHYAVHDETVNSFGRDDEIFEGAAVRGRG